MDTNCALIMGGFAIITMAMGYGYKIYFDRKSIKLEKNDKKHDQVDDVHEKRIKKIEEKNGAEQHQLNEHKKEIDELKKDKGELKDLVIKLQDRIIGCEKNNGSSKKDKKISNA